MKLTFTQDVIDCREDLDLEIENLIHLIASELKKHEYPLHKLVNQLKPLNC